MKIRRYKKVQKRLNYYCNNFGFRQPYQLLMDGTFCSAALKNKINIADNLPRYLDAQLKLITTQCAIVEMERLGPSLTGALLILKQYLVHKCGHEGSPITGQKCFLSMLTQKNANHYMIATQDRDLQEKVRLRAGVPLIYLHSKTPILEEPSDASVKRVRKLGGLSVEEQERIEEMKLKSGLVEVEAVKKPRRKKPKAPNPLSCRKSKKQIHPEIKVATVEEGKVVKKKRKKVRIPQHFRDEILKNKVAEGLH